MSRSWQPILLPAASIGLAFLEADSVLIGQWMLSRPILLGPLIGLAFGQFWIGLLLGTINELFSLDEKPMGAIVPLNAAVSTGCAALLSVGPYRIPVAASFLAGLGLGLAHQRVENSLRRRRSILAYQVERDLREQSGVRWATILLRSIGTHIAVTAVFIYLAVTLAAPAISWIWIHAPQVLRVSVNTAFSAAPWVGLATLIHALTKRE